MPAGILMPASWRQVAYGSDQPSTRNPHVPVSSGDTNPRNRSSPGATSTIGDVERSFPSGPTRTAVAATASWPSRNTVASTGTSSPTAAFAGQRPSAMVGETSTTGMRPMPGAPVTAVPWGKPTGAAGAVTLAAGAGAVVRAAAVRVDRPPAVDVERGRRVAPAGAGVAADPWLAVESVGFVGVVALAAASVSRVAAADGRGVARRGVVTVRTYRRGPKRSPEPRRALASRLSSPWPPPAEQASFAPSKR
ncbi:hypothetical protein GCM10025864_30150 [Luteimicrobium album]|uniref:Uncharacterized protein n=1 Tax=Luteimicrobium album TaxID=1054550 RepID=A0ABQ6I3E7_9MICO|nr:hypothetical protein GCM10025864_30150 [Luteimicrobium album]